MKVLLLVVLFFTFAHCRPLDDENQAQEGDDKRDKISNPPDVAAAHTADSPTPSAENTADSPTPSAENAADSPTPSAENEAASSEPSDMLTEPTTDNTKRVEENAAKKAVNPTLAPTTVGPPATAPTKPPVLTTTNAVKPSSPKPTTVAKTSLPSSTNATIVQTTPNPATTVKATEGCSQTNSCVSGCELSTCSPPTQLTTIKTTIKVTTKAPTTSQPSTTHHQITTSPPQSSTEKPTQAEKKEVKKASQATKRSKGLVPKKTTTKPTVSKTHETHPTTSFFDLPKSTKAGSLSKKATIASSTKSQLPKGTTTKGNKITTEAPTNKPKTVEKSTNDTLTMKGTTFHVAIRFLDEKFTDDLNFPQNPVYQSLKQHVMTTVAEVYKEYKDYKQIVVIKFSDAKGEKDPVDNADKRNDIDNPGVVVDMYMRFYTPGKHLEKLTEAVQAGKLGTHPVSKLFVRAYVAEPKGRVCTPDCKIQCYSYCDAGCCHLNVYQHVTLPEENPADVLIAQRKQQAEQVATTTACQGNDCSQPAAPQASMCQGSMCIQPQPLQEPCQGPMCQMLQMPCQGPSCAPQMPMPQMTMQQPCQGIQCAPQMPMTQPCQSPSCFQMAMMPGMPPPPARACKGASCHQQLVPQLQPMMPQMGFAMPPPMLVPTLCPPSCSQVCGPTCPNQCCGMQMYG